MQVSFLPMHRAVFYKKRERVENNRSKSSVHLHSFLHNMNIYPSLYTDSWNYASSNAVAFAPMMKQQTFHQPSTHSHLNTFTSSTATVGNYASTANPTNAHSYHQQVISNSNASTQNINPMTGTAVGQMSNNNPLPTTGLTVQDYPQNEPVYNGVNPNYPNLQVIHRNPPIFAVPDFLSHAECDFLICIAQDCFTPAPVVGKGAGEVSSSRTSSTCYLAREDLPEYLNKVSLLTGKPIEHCELPQVGRYFPSQQYLQHFDAFDLSNEDGVRFASNGGQRTVTVLTYLNDVERGGHTAFPNLNLEVQPKKGMALIFFPATVDGLLDKNALHAAMPAIDTKYVSQVWIRQGRYEGVPSKRIFTSPEQASLVQKSLICATEGSLSSPPSSQCLSEVNDNNNHGEN